MKIGHLLNYYQTVTKNEPVKIRSIYPFRYENIVHAFALNGLNEETRVTMAQSSRWRAAYATPSRLTGCPRRAYA